MDHSDSTAGSKPTARWSIDVGSKSVLPLQCMLDEVPTVPLRQAVMGGPKNKGLANLNLDTFKFGSELKFPSNEKLQSILNGVLDFASNCGLLKYLPSVIDGVDAVDFVGAVTLFTMEEPFPFYLLISSPLNMSGVRSVRAIECQLPYLKLITVLMETVPRDCEYWYGGITYRGLDVEKSESLLQKYNDYQRAFAPGTKLTFAAPTSTTKNDATARQFTKGIQYVIQGCDGKGGAGGMLLQPNDVSVYEEDEVLLKAPMNFEVVAATKPEDTVVVILKVVPSPMTYLSEPDIGPHSRRQEMEAAAAKKARKEAGIKGEGKVKDGISGNTEVVELLEWINSRLDKLLSKEAIATLSETLVKQDVTCLDLLLSCEDADLRALVPSLASRIALNKAIVQHKQDMQEAAEKARREAAAKRDPETSDDLSALFSTAPAQVPASLVRLPVGTILGAGVLKDPYYVALDREGRIMVSDVLLHQVLVFSTDGALARRFGSDKGSGAAAGQFNCPQGVAVDGQGRVIVADFKNHRIQVLNADGSVARCFGSEGTAVGQLRQPSGVAVDSQGRIVVAEYGNHRVQVFNSDGSVASHFGSRGSTVGQLNGPLGVAVDGAGRIAVADRLNHRVQVFNRDGSVSLCFGSKGDRPGQLHNPIDVAVDKAGHFVVADSSNHRIQVLSGDGSAVRVVGAPGPGVGQLKFPSGVAVDGAGRIIVAEAKCGNRRLQLL